MIATVGELLRQLERFDANQIVFIGFVHDALVIDFNGAGKIGIGDIFRSKVGDRRVLIFCNFPRYENDYRHGLMTTANVGIVRAKLAQFAAFEPVSIGLYDPALWSVTGQPDNTITTLAIHQVATDQRGTVLFVFKNPQQQN
jgi:hypothetical protein